MFWHFFSLKSTSLNRTLLWFEAKLSRPKHTARTRQSRHRIRTENIRLTHSDALMHGSLFRAPSQLLDRYPVQLFVPCRANLPGPPLFIGMESVFQTCADSCLVVRTCICCSLPPDSTGRQISSPPRQSVISPPAPCGKAPCGQPSSRTSSLAPTLMMGTSAM